MKRDSSTLFNNTRIRQSTKNFA